MNERLNERFDARTVSERNASTTEISFEEAFRRLEAIVSTLETGRGELEESLAKYEEGIRLLRRCRQILDGAERRVEILKGLDANGDPILERADENALRSQTDVAGRQTPPATSPKNSFAPPTSPPISKPTSDSRPNLNLTLETLPPKSEPTQVAARRGVRRAPAKSTDLPPTGSEKAPVKRSEPAPKSRSFFDDEPPF